MKVVTGYKPREHQVELHKAIKAHRFSVVVAHRRFGKTVAAVNHLIDAALRSKLERPRYAYIAPFRNQAKTIAWDYVKHFTQNLPGIAFNEAELRADMPNGSRITLFGADNANALRGQYFDGVVFDEYAQIAPTVFSEVVRPALSDRMGWCVFGGTPQGRNHFYSLIELAKSREDWAVSIYKASQTNVIIQSELDAALLEMGEDRYKQEFECSFDASVIGSYYSEHIKTAEEQGRITAVPLEGALSVHTAWDLGMGDDTAIWCYQQSPGGQVRVIDYIENHGVGLDWYVREIKDRALKGNWVLGEHLLPHDVEVRELGTGRSRFDTLVGLGIRPNICPKLGIDDGINAVRVLFPRLWFDTNENVQRGLDALRQYRREYDEKRQVFYEKPLHNWTSHACLDGDSLIKTLRGDVPIRDVVVGDYAWTPAGYALVSASGATKVATAMIEVSLSNGQILLCTPEHKIFTTRGVVVADSLRYNDGVITQRNAPCLLSQKIRFAGYRDAYIESFKGNAIGFGLSETFTLRKLVGDFACFIKRYTERFTAICRAMYDQRTETFATPTPITGRFTELSQNESTPFKRWTEYAFTTNQKGITKPITQNMVASQCTVTFGKSTMEKYQKGFTSITKTETKPTTTYQTLNCCLQKSTCLITQKKARGLVAGQMLKNLGRLAIWLRLGTLHQKGLLGTVKMENAYGKTSRGFLETAMNAAGNTLRRILTGQNSATKIVRLRRLEGAEASRLVYDLTVEKHHCYLANGVLVSNSDAMRYLAVGLREASSTVPIRRALKGIV